MSDDSDDTNKPTRPFLPTLQQVEAEGEAAARKLARALVHETLRNGGRINIARLEQAGPTVEAAYRSLLAQAAARSHAPPTEVAATPGNGGSTAEQSAAYASQQSALTRIEKGWRDQRRPTVSFKAAAWARGLLAGAFAFAAALAAVVLFRP